MWAETFILLTALQTGERLDWRDSLKSGQTLVLVEKDCHGCEIYFRNLKKCRPELLKDVSLVSISPGRATKDMARKFPKGPQVYLAEMEKFRGLAAATPTTFRLSKEGNLISSVGPKTCADLEK